MQIFGDNKYVTGIEYRDEKTGELREGSFLIDDASPEAQKILEGYDFTVVKGAVVIGQNGTMKTELERRAAVKARIQELLAKQPWTAAEVAEVARLTLRILVRVARETDL